MKRCLKISNHKRFEAWSITLWEDFPKEEKQAQQEKDASELLWLWSQILLNPLKAPNPVILFFDLDFKGID